MKKFYLREGNFGKKREVTESAYQKAAMKYTGKTSTSAFRTILMVGIVEDLFLSRGEDLPIPSSRKIEEESSSISPSFSIEPSPNIESSSDSFNGGGGDSSGGGSSGDF